MTKMAKILNKVIYGLGALSWATSSLHLFLMFSGKMEPTPQYCGIGGLAAIYTTFMMVHGFMEA